MARFIMLIYGDEQAWAAEDSDEESQALGEHQAFEAEMQRQGRMLGGEALHRVQTATTVRVLDGAVSATDGPFAETREQLGGYYILDCRDQDHAVQVAAAMPGVMRGTTTIEVRPIREFS